MTSAEPSDGGLGSAMLQCFVREQMVREPNVRAVLERIRLTGNAGVGVVRADG